MKVRLFLVKREFRYEPGCKVTLFAVTDNDTNCLNNLTEVVQHSLPDFDPDIEGFRIEEVSHIENWAENPETAAVVYGQTRRFFMPVEP